MRINLRPPMLNGANDADEAIRILGEWCENVCSELDRVLSNIDENNLSAHFKDKIFTQKGDQ